MLSLYASLRGQRHLYVTISEGARFVGYGDIFSPSLDKINTPVTPSVCPVGYIKSTWNGVIGLDKCVDENPLSQYFPF